MRIVGVDYGARRIGLAVSDASGTVARPWKALAAAADVNRSAADVAAALTTLDRDVTGEPLAVDAIVVGLPRRLNGEETSMTQAARAFADRLGGRTGLPVHLQDERLSSREAESRLSVRERDWRKRKALIDAAAAAIVLQDFLDARAAATLAGDDR